MPTQVLDGDRYRCPVQGCGCEITVARAPDMDPTQKFVERRGHGMERAG